MTLEQLIEERGFRHHGEAGSYIVIMATDVVDWATEQIQHGNLLPGATKPNYIAECVSNIKAFNHALTEDAAFGYVAGAPNDVLEQARKSVEKLGALVDGKVLVPVEYTLTMLLAGADEVKKSDDDEDHKEIRKALRVWKAMLAASQEQKQ